ncbi:WYL domain-containing protein [Roseivirga sp.]|uniref:WYL domain-containing protein n=1 Tax=Roseivirga sp. TaxID=1964215 RepID=UPI002B26C240|nr:WYL domain-containing protein [Roseivirga sp.]
MGLLDFWNKPKAGIKETLSQAISSGMAIKIEYRNYDGASSKRKVSKVQYHNEYQAEGYHNAHIRGYCHRREEERTFKIDRIISIELVR